jgi:hypothetical protein
MKMIRHEDIGVNLPTRLGASLAQRLNEALPIRIIHEDPFAPVTAIHDVINRASILDSQLAGHDGRVALAALCINIKNRPRSRLLSNYLEANPLSLEERGEDGAPLIPALAALTAPPPHRSLAL